MRRERTLVRNDCGRADERVRAPLVPVETASCSVSTGEDDRREESTNNFRLNAPSAATRSSRLRYCEDQQERRGRRGEATHASRRACLACLSALAASAPSDFFSSPRRFSCW